MMLPEEFSSIRFPMQVLTNNRFIFGLYFQHRDNPFNQWNDDC